MYLSDEDCETFKLRMWKWLTDEETIKESDRSSFLFFRESCFTSIGGLSGDSTSSPAHYRAPEFYTELFSKGDLFELISHGNMKLYEKTFKYLFIFN